MTDFTGGFNTAESNPIEASLVVINGRFPDYEPGKRTNNRKPLIGGATSNEIFQIQKGELCLTYKKGVPIGPSTQFKDAIPAFSVLNGFGDKKKSFTETLNSLTFAGFAKTPTYEPHDQRITERSFVLVRGGLFTIRNTSNVSWEIGDFLMWTLPKNTDRAQELQQYAGSPMKNRFVPILKPVRVSDMGSDIKEMFKLSKVKLGLNKNDLEPYQVNCQHLSEDIRHIMFLGSLITAATSHNLPPGTSMHLDANSYPESHKTPENFIENIKDLVASADSKNPEQGMYSLARIFGVADEPRSNRTHFSLLLEKVIEDLICTEDPSHIIYRALDDRDPALKTLQRCQEIIPRIGDSILDIVRDISERIVARAVNPVAPGHKGDVLIGPQYMA